MNPEIVLNALKDALIIVDKQGIVCWYNDAAGALFTLKNTPSPESVVGRPIHEVLANEEFVQKLTTILQQPQKGSASPHHHFIFLSERQHGEIYKTEITHLADGRVLLSIANHTYIHHLEQMRTDFVGNVSHEMRTPLTVLMGYLENFNNAADMPAKWARGIKLMTEQAVRLNNIVDDLLMLSRLEHDDSTPAVMVDMPRVLMQVFDEAQASNAEGAHLIDLHLDTDKNVLGLEVYLHSAISNLVLNAIKYTPKGGEINIIWEEVEGGALLSVKDEGIGIAKEHLSRLTERFYRVDSGRSRATGGTGLGLAIVKHVLMKHDATLQIKSAQNKGSTFSVFFPKSRLI